MCLSFVPGLTWLLAACVVAPGKPAPAARDTGVAIAGSTRFVPAPFAGIWWMRQSTNGVSDPGSLEMRMTRADSFRFAEQYADVANSRSGTGRVTGPGRFVVDFDPTRTKREIWVLWVDADFRTAAIGTPDGSFGWIIDRKPAGGADRIAAARDVLAFNGYDLTQLETRQ